MICFKFVMMLVMVCKKCECHPLKSIFTSIAPERDTTFISFSIPQFDKIVNWLYNAENFIFRTKYFSIFARIFFNAYYQQAKES